MIPDHPRDLVYPESSWRLPDRAAMRCALPSGVPLYSLADRSLPAVRASLFLRAGSAYDPPGMSGLAEWTAASARAAGAGRLGGEEVDRAIEAVGAQIEVGFSPDFIVFKLHALSANAAAALAILADMALRPRFEARRAETERGRIVTRIRHRDDYPGQVAERVLAERVYGPHPVALSATEAGVGALTLADAAGFHQAAWGPSGAILAVSGDIDTGRARDLLAGMFEGWTGGSPRPVPPVEAPPRPGVLIVPKETNQGYVRIGHLGVTMDHPDFEALEVMNHILGGGSFTSRLTSRIRSDEGLAYSVRSRIEPAARWRGLFSAAFQSRSARVAQAAAIVFAEIRRIREEAVSEEELAGAKAAILDSFPDEFSTAHETVLAFARAEFDGLPPDHFEQTLSRTRLVSARDVLRVAGEHLRPDEASIVIVGDLGTIRGADPERPERIEDLGTVEVG